MIVVLVIFDITTAKIGKKPKAQNFRIFFYVDFTF